MLACAEIVRLPVEYRPRLPGINDIEDVLSRVRQVDGSYHCVRVCREMVFAVTAVLVHEQSSLIASLQQQAETQRNGSVVEEFDLDICDDDSLVEGDEIVIAALRCHRHEIELFATQILQLCTHFIARFTSRHQAESIVLTALTTLM